MKEKWSDERGGVVLLEAEEEDDDHGETARDASSPAAATATVDVDDATTLEDECDEHDDMLLDDGSELPRCLAAAGLDDE